MTTKFLKKFSMATVGATFILAGTVASAQAAGLGGQIYSSGGDVQVKILPPNPNVGYTSDT